MRADEPTGTGGDRRDEHHPPRPRYRVPGASLYGSRKADLREAIGDRGPDPATRTRYQRHVPVEVNVCPRSQPVRTVLLAVDAAHVRIALAGGHVLRGDFLDTPQILIRELDVCGGDVLFEVLAPLGAWDGNDVVVPVK